MQVGNYNSLAASLAAGRTCIDYDFMDSSWYLRPFLGVLYSFVGQILCVLYRFVCQNRYQSVAGAVFENRYRWNTFTFKIEKFRILYRFVCQNHYRSVADAVFENRLSVGVFANKLWHTEYFLNCMPLLHINAPDSELSFLIQNRYFVCHVCQKQIK